MPDLQLGIDGSEEPADAVMRRDALLRRLTPIQRELLRNTRLHGEVSAEDAGALILASRNVLFPTHDELRNAGSRALKHLTRYGLLTQHGDVWKIA